MFQIYKIIDLDRQAAYTRFFYILNYRYMFSFKFKYSESGVFSFGAKMVGLTF